MGSRGNYNRATISFNHNIAYMQIKRVMCHGGVDK